MFPSGADVAEFVAVPAIRPPRVSAKLMSETLLVVMTIGVLPDVSQEAEQGMLL